MQKPRAKLCTQRSKKRLSRVLSHTAFDAVELRAALEQATAAGDWLRVAELAAVLAALAEG